MCKELLVILIVRVVTRKDNREKWEAKDEEEEERHKGSLIKNNIKGSVLQN
jgi:hypothetical protein